VALDDELLRVLNLLAAIDISFAR